MSEIIMIGCDLHEQNMLTLMAAGRGEPTCRTYGNTEAGISAMVSEARQLARRHGAGRIVLAYEASSLGFALHDVLVAEGLECHVLAPSRIERSVKQRRAKTDRKDAKQLLEILRGHVLGGNDLPSIWVPEAQLRDDRELVRARLEAAESAGRIKTKVQSLLKRYDLRKPATAGQNWTLAHRDWLWELAGSSGPLAPGTSQALASLLRRLVALEQEIVTLDKAIAELAGQARYAKAVQATTARKGIGLLTAMVFLTELGTMSRFSNRRQLASFLGLVPSCHESGEACDRKGHITRQGPGRVRKVLCQAVWSMIRCDPEVSRRYAELVLRNPKKRKVAAVAMMRRVAIWMWHRGVEAQADGAWAA